jgi:hypothetical protein
VPQMNPDGTMQVAPPTQSAFGPASASAPPPPMQAQPVQPVGHPGFSGAIQDLVAMLAKVLGPKSITQAPQREAQREAEAQGLGDQLGPQR